MIVRHLKIEEVSKPGGLSLVFQTLEASPLVKELDGQRGEKAQREFLRCRQSGEAMESFIMRVQAQRAVMEEEDPMFGGGDSRRHGGLLDLSSQVEGLEAGEGVLQALRTSCTT